MASNNNNSGGDAATNGGQRARRNASRFSVVAWTEIDGDESRKCKEMVLDSWLSNDGQVISWPGAERYRFALLNDDAPDATWATFQVDEIRLRSAREATCESLLRVETQPDDEVNPSDLDDDDNDNESSPSGSESDAEELKKEEARLALEMKRKKERKERKMKEREKARKEREEMLIEKERVRRERDQEEEGRKKKKSRPGKEKTGRTSLKRKRDDNDIDDNRLPKRKSIDAEVANSRLCSGGDSSRSSPAQDRVVPQEPPLLTPIMNRPRGPPLHYSNTFRDEDGGSRPKTGGRNCSGCEKLTDEVAKLRQDIKEMLGVVRAFGRSNIAPSSSYHLPVLGTPDAIWGVNEYSDEDMGQMVLRFLQIGGTSVREALRRMISAVIPRAMRSRVTKTGKEGKVKFVKTDLYKRGIRPAIVQLLKSSDAAVDKELSDILKQLAFASKQSKKDDRESDS